MTTHTPKNQPNDDSPAERIAKVVAELGEDDVIARATALIAGLNAGEEFLLAVGGRHAQGILDGAPPLYWREVLGALTFLYVWNDSATPAVLAGLGNQAWRVREMSAKVVARRELAYPAEVAVLATDEVARVRAQAARALGEIGTADQIDVLRSLLKDPEIEVRREAGGALKKLRAKLPAATSETPESPEDTGATEAAPEN
ncbi:HEAT repeat domain-containing protein [Conyzicola sp.]|uniref:HEAT repeat domain-containing protein n=1 Tax=Conyzicola sp. TaxID=1969404 RepID=UPI00398916F1